MKDKKEQEDDFYAWLDRIPERIEQLSTFLPEEVFRKLTYTVQSLDALGNYLVSHETAESIQEKKDFLDCLASYVGLIYERSISMAEWCVELDDDQDIFYGLPALRTKMDTLFAPHIEIAVMLDNEQNDFLSTIISNHIALIHDTRSRWINAVESFATDIHAVVKCPSCNEGFLFATDVPFDELNKDAGGERYLKCKDCARFEIVLYHIPPANWLMLPGK